MGVLSATICHMDVAALQNELQALPPEQQDRMSAFLTALRLQRDGGMTEIRGRLDDKSPESWLSWDDVKDEQA